MEMDGKKYRERLTKTSRVGRSSEKQSIVSRMNGNYERSVHQYRDTICGAISSPSTPAEELRVG